MTDLTMAFGFVLSSLLILIKLKKYISKSIPFTTNKKLILKLACSKPFCTKKPNKLTAIKINNIGCDFF
jgi:hypothetical protein